MKLIFLGTPPFAAHCLDALIQDPEVDVVAVVSQPDKPQKRGLKVHQSAVKTLATQHKLPVFTFEDFKTEWSPLKKYNADGVLVVAFGQILPKDFLDFFSNKVMNVHGSLLPKLRGAAPIQRAILENHKTTGVTLQVVSEKLDCGDMIAKKEVAIEKTQNAFDLFSILEKKSIELLQTEMKQYLRGEIKPTPQKEDEATWAAKIKKEEGLLDFNRSAEDLHCQIRAFAMGPKSWFFCEGKKLFITQAEISPGQSKSIGEIVETGEDFFHLACAKGFLKVLRVQPESRKEMSVSEYLRGKRS